jgi:hypothetical protein
MKPPEETLNSLRTLLVQEFRTCQRIAHLLKEERGALLHGDTQEILAQSTEVNAALEELKQIDRSRLALANRGGQPAKRPSKSRAKTNYHPPRTGGSSLKGPNLSKDSQMEDLEEGVKILRQQIYENVRSNTILASKALERTDAMQLYLTSLYQTQPVQIANNLAQSNFPAVLAALLRTREALNSGEPDHISQAIMDLQSALTQLEEALDASVTETIQPNTASSANLAPEAQETSLVKKMIDLHQRRNAYQAIYQSRMHLLV